MLDNYFGHKKQGSGTTQILLADFFGHKKRGPGNDCLQFIQTFQQEQETSPYCWRLAKLFLKDRLWFNNLFRLSGREQYIRYCFSIFWSPTTDLNIRNAALT